MLKIRCLSIVLYMLMVSGCGSDKKDRHKYSDKATAYQVGYKAISFVDSSRTYRRGVKQNDPLYFRPIDVDLWYPAQPRATDSTLKFGYFLQLLEDRANFYSAPQKFDHLPTTIAKSFCDVFGCSRADVLLQVRTNTFNRAKAVPEQFPLIMYFASFGSMGYENYLLFESLARQGYIVACVNSIGRYPGDMTMKNADLMQQVSDADHIVSRLGKHDGIDTTKIGVLGYSWGGFAGVLWAMKRSDIAAVVSLDGSEMHHYGHSKSEDQDFDATVNTPFFRNTTLSAPYLRFESNPEPGRFKKDSVYHFLRKCIALKHAVKIDSAEHQDFSALSTVVRLSGGCSVSKTYHTVTKGTISYYNRYLKYDSNDRNP